MSAAPAPGILAIGFAVLAAVLYGISSPVSKVLLDSVPPALLAALLYLGAGVGMAVVSLVQLSWCRYWHGGGQSGSDLAQTYGSRSSPWKKRSPVRHRDDCSRYCCSHSADVWSYHDHCGKRVPLSVAWGFENNCTRMLSLKDPVQIVTIKGFGAGGGALLLALLAQETNADTGGILAALLLGFFAYGLSIYFYVLAQRSLGAARTSAFYAVAPFIGVGLSFVIPVHWCRALVCDIPDTADGFLCRCNRDYDCGSILCRNRRTSAPAHPPAADA